MTSNRFKTVVLSLFLFSSLVFSPTPTVQAQPAFPGAKGFGTDTPGGRGGKVFKVTNLDASGPGSLAEALQAEGPRIVVFEVGGVINFEGRSLRIRNPFLTVAGQTAPSPGITIVRGGIGISTHDVILRHLRVRTGDDDRPKKSGWEVDGIATSGGAFNVVVDHCSIAWATDENLSASGPRFEGENEEEWRQNTSHDVTFSHCIIAEGLENSTHAKGGHSKGSLIHDNATNISIIGNLYASNVDRNPLFKGGVHGVIVNNLIDNPKNRAVHYRLVSGEWGDRTYLTGKMALVGNDFRYGPDTPSGRVMMSFDGEGPLELYEADNLAFDREGNPVEILAIGDRGRSEDLKRLDEPPLWPEGLEPLAVSEVRESVLQSAGARPWDRDEVDFRVVRQVIEGKGQIIDSQKEVGGYPAPESTTRKLDVPTESLEDWLESFCKPINR